MKKKNNHRDVQIAEEIIRLKFKDSDTFKSCWQKFFRIMRKHGIKQGTTYIVDGKVVGTSIANYEWTLYKNLFLKRFENEMNFRSIIGMVPKDLWY